MPSAVGDLVLTTDGSALTGVYVGRPLDGVRLGDRCDEGPLGMACEQLAAYFAGELREFDVPLAPRGTRFQRRVWEAARRVPYGATTTYGALAERVGSPSAAQAVGAASARNPISIMIPCHRVTTSAGRSGGDAAGVERKRFLLALERQGGAGRSS